MNELSVLSHQRLENCRRPKPRDESSAQVSVGGERYRLIWLQPRVCRAESERDILLVVRGTRNSFRRCFHGCRSHFGALEGP